MKRINLFKGLDDGYKRQILNLLPGPGDLTKGLTRKQILESTMITPEKASGYLQSLKRQHKVKCIYGKWRKNKISLF